MKDEDIPDHDGPYLRGDDNDPKGSNLTMFAILAVILVVAIYLVLENDDRKRRMELAKANAELAPPQEKLIEDLINEGRGGRRR